MEDATLRRRHARALPRRCAAPGSTTSASSCRRTCKRTLRDIAELRDLRPSVRLCKGIYVEPRVDRLPATPTSCAASFVACLDALLDGGSRVGDRDPRRAPARASRSRASPASATTATSSRCCSACARRRASELVAAGHRLRVYVPFGQRWYEYSLRRLQENPQMAGVIAKATVGRDGRPRRRGEAAPRLRRQREAAVDDQRLAADHLRVGRAEERDGAGDVLRA